MKKIFTFLMFILLVSNIAGAQTIRGVAPSWTGGDPGLKTMSATSISDTMVVFKVLYNSLDTQYSSSDAPLLYVEYGPSGTLGYQTETRPQNTGNRTEEFTVNGLQKNKLYYYRAVLLYNNKTAYGQVLEYTHKGTPVTVTTTDTVNDAHDDEIVSSPGTPKDIVLFPFLKNIFKKKETVDVSRPSSIITGGIKLVLTNKITETVSGDKPIYTIQYANNSGKTYEDVDIEILLPPEYEFVNTNKGDYYPDVHTVLVKLYTFQAGENGVIQITTYANGKKTNKKSEASAHLYSDNGEMIIYDIDTYTAGKTVGNMRTARDTDNKQPAKKDAARRGSTATGNPLAGSTMIGWVIIALIIGAVVFISYKYFKKDKY
jgi:hypothetical protein